MIKTILLQNKLEMQEFYEDNYIERDNLSIATSEINSSLIKIIIGPRRAGKSTFAFLLLKDKKVGYLNFDDDNLLRIENLDTIIEGIHEVYGDVEYLFFYEIQNLSNWELFINKLKRRKYKIILTGSNANLLSQDIATVLTGRYILYEILPFGLAEYLKFNKISVSENDFHLPKKKAKILEHAEKYLLDGGYPEILKEDINPINYLSTLFDATLFKDIVTRYNLRNPTKLKELAYYLVSNFTSLFTYNSLAKNLKYNSVETLEKYVSYLESSYLFFTLNRFSFKFKEQNNSPKKIYIVDNGLVKSKAIRFSKDYGRFLENAVFVELLRKKFIVNENLFYYSCRNGKEIDFIIKDLTEVIEIYQVSYSIENEMTRDREISALITASKELNCDELFLITWNEEDIIELNNNINIQVIPFYKWVLI